MAFAQLTFRESLRDFEACLRAHQDKLYRMGIRGGMARNTLANANQRRDWRTSLMMETNRRRYASDTPASSIRISENDRMDVIGVRNS